MKAQFGIIGLATMGQNLALNIARHGFSVAGYNRSPERTKALMERVQDEPILPTYSLREFVVALKTPRAILLMVQAGKPVDEVVSELFPLLEPGDLVIDGGNSHFSDTERRIREAQSRGLFYLGVGISGGEAGALHGPAIMAGGDQEGYVRVEPIFKSIAAQGLDGPCVGYFGPGGAGHYVKMVHNGIEYAIMQAIAECYDLLKRGLGFSPPEISEIFSEWNQGELESYLLEITVNILRTRDPETGGFLVEAIKDTAEQKGTGKWSTQDALDLGAPTPTIAEAVFARIVSALKEERLAAERILAGPEPRLPIPPGEFLMDLKRAYALAVVTAYSQGFRQLRDATAEHGYDFPLAEVARVWTGGCIIRARLLAEMREAFRREPSLPLLLLAEPFRQFWKEGHESLRNVVCAAHKAGIPVPAMSSVLNFLDAYRTGRLPANLIQAQRDYFGAHTYERLDKPGKFHTHWEEASRC
ncbi:NADP-dependent phosphogluconate dehydrogenase [Candidatus Bipolaricaulota bacterium]|nr:NADP-dependent phosphogluconate dehydrogenase [Candidatus Bipolaricaulota bacterium]